MVEVDKLPGLKIVQGDSNGRKVEQTAPPRHALLQRKPFLLLFMNILQILVLQNAAIQQALRIGVI